MNKNTTQFLYVNTENQFYVPSASGLAKFYVFQFESLLLVKYFIRSLRYFKNSQAAQVKTNIVSSRHNLEKYVLLQLGKEIGVSLANSYVIPRIVFIYSDLLM